ncbi:unnamed protein product [Bursaphelenchus xylophilus]|uniref:(pine wood nematode) hypothetical protein n=1 Tax=Bursaphelenchus xylophilus TaxID=6326 RepID=A0A1I7SLZ2_BURXY|nr:unnamed protein product [Bursaphelenchus xylophilus]CAG9129939.1 unnamed protein product [Bursaphelenchus xylophilus]
MSSWGVTGAAKPRSHNVNSVYAGRNNASGRAAGSVKNGLQVLGKTSTIVRRMPPPATLPSLKSEIGQDPSVIIVPQGGQGWNKPADTSDNKNSENQSNSPDLRPNWAKSAANGQAAPVEKVKPNPAHSLRVGKAAGNAATNSREFPPLAAAVGTSPTKSTPPSTTGALTASNDLSKSSRQPSSKADESADKIVNIPPPQSTGSGYIGASTAPRSNVDRKIPDRYIGAPEGSRPSNQPNKRYDFRQKLAQLSMDSKEKSEERQLAQKVVEPVHEIHQTSPQPAVQTPQPEPYPVHAQPLQPQGGRSQDVRRLYSQPQEPMEEPSHEGWGRPLQDEYSKPRQDFYQPQPLTSGHGDSGYQKPPRYDEPNNWEDAARWGPPPPDRRPRQSSYRAEDEWYPRNEGNGYHGNEYAGKYDNGGFQGRNRPVSNSYSDEFDAYGMYGNERRTKRRSENGDDNQNRYHRDMNRDREPTREMNEYFEGQKSQGYNRNQAQQPVYRMLKRNDEKSAEYFSTRSNLSSMTEEESAETLSQLTRFGRPVKHGQYEQRQSQESLNRFNKAPGAGKPQNQKEVHQKESRPQVPAENVWKKRMEEQQQQQVQKQQEEKHTWGEAKHTRKFDYHFPVMEKDEATGWDDVNEGNGYHEDHDQRREQRNRRPQKPQAPVQRPRMAPEQNRKPVGNRQKKRNEPEDNFSNMGEFHAEDYTITEVAPPRPFQNNFEDGFASVDMMEQETKEKKQRRTPNEEGPRPLKPQRGAPVNKSWRDSKPRRTPEESSDNADKRKSGGNRSQNQRGPRREYNRGNRNDEDEELEETHSNGSDARRFDNSTGSKKSIQRPSKPRPKPSQSKPQIQSEVSKPQTPTSSSQQPRPQNQKNAKPASPTSQNNVAFGKSNDENNSPQLSKNAKLNARENRRPAKEAGTVRYGLAGVDLNNASVFVIDNQPEQSTDGQSESGEFEEVLSRKAKKQRQEQQRQEEERVSKEKARLERQEQQKKCKQKDEKSKKQPKKKEEIRKRKDSEAKSTNDSFSPVSATDSGCIAVSSTSHVSGESGPEVSLSGLTKSSVWNDPGIITTSPLQHDFRQNIPAPIARPTSKTKDNVPLELTRESEALLYNNAIPEPDFDFRAGQISPKASYINDDHAAELQKKVSKVKDIWPGEDTAYLHNDLLPKEDITRATDLNGAMDTDRDRHIDHRSIPQRQLSESQSSLNSPAFLAQSNGFSSHYSFLPSNSQPFGHQLANSPPSQLAQNFLAPRNYVEPNYFGPTQTDWSNMELMNGLASPSPIQYFNNTQMNVSPAQRFQQPPSTNFRPTSRLINTQTPQPAMNTSVPPPNMNIAKHPVPMVPFNGQLTHHIPMGPFVPPPPVSQVDFSVPPPPPSSVGVVGGHRQQMACNQVNGQRNNSGGRTGMFNGGPPPMFRNGQRRSSHNSGGMGPTPSPGLPTHLTWNPSMNGAGTFGLF